MALETLITTETLLFLINGYSSERLAPAKTQRQNISKYNI